MRTALQFVKVLFIINNNNIFIIFDIILCNQITCEKSNTNKILYIYTKPFVSKLITSSCLASAARSSRPFNVTFSSAALLFLYVLFEWQLFNYTVTFLGIQADRVDNQNWRRWSPVTGCQPLHAICCLNTLNCSAWAP